MVNGPDYEEVGPDEVSTRKCGTQGKFMRIPIMQVGKKSGQFVRLCEMNHNSVWRAWIKLGPVMFGGKGRVEDIPSH